jgi:ribonucleoside-diphosphate reductase alpha chain
MECMGIMLDNPVSKQEALQDAEDHFDGDNMAAETFLRKYAVQLPQDEVDSDKKFLETSPEDMWERMAKAGASIEDNGDKWKKKFYNAFKDWKIVPQGSIMFALGNPYQKSSASNCFVEGTTVHTVNQGIKNIEDVEEGDKVVTHKGNVEDVVQTHKNKLNGRQVYRFKAFQSPEVKVTGNHGVWSISQEQIEWGEDPQWNDVKYLRKGDWVAMPNNPEGEESISVDLSNTNVPTSFEETDDSVWYELDYDGGSIELISKYYYGDKEDENIHTSNQQSRINRFIELDQDFAFFLGVWLGDGCVYSDNRPIKGISFTFSENEERLARWVVDYISETFNYNANITHNNNQSTYQINVTCPLIGWFMNHYFGRGVRSKKLWERCHEWNKSCVESLIAGLVSSDGTVTKSGQVRVVTVNQSLMRDVYNLARSKGIPIGYSESKRDTNYSNEVKTARLSFSRNHPIVDLVTKHYEDNRIEESMNKEFQSQQLKKINGCYFVRLNEKEKIETDDDYVYTFGVKNDHSYSVAGLNFQNCFVIPVKDDSIEGIFDTAKEIARTYSYRGGVGTDISILRPKDSVVHNCSRQSTGAVSFMDFYSYITNLIGQNGRRGALMLTISDKHPDLYHPEADGMDFINIKRDLDKVTGANISVRVSDAFMTAVENNQQWTLSWERKNNKVYVGDEFVAESEGPDIRVERSYPAQNIWDNIVDSATESAEPGVLFWDRVKQESPADMYADEGFETTCTNPCSEIPLSNYDACTLLSVNLTEFVKNPFTDNARIDGRALKDHINTAVRFLDNVKELDADKVPLDKQANVAMRGRRIGIGTHGLGDMLAMLGMKYDSDEAVKQCDKLYDYFKNQVYQASANLAGEKGTFPIYDEEKHFRSPFIQRLNSKTKSMIKENGLRNIACLTMAPTGTVSMLSQTSSGIEPIFRLQYERNVRTGGEAETFEVNHHLVDQYLNEVAGADTTDDLPDYFQTVEDIDYVKRTELQGVIQKHIDHAISNTINIPADVDDPEQIVSDSYFKAWEEGCKGYTVYVDGSREEAPLQSGEQEPEKVSDHLEYKADTKVWEVQDEYGHYFLTEGHDQIFVNGYRSSAGRLNPSTIELSDNIESVLKAHIDDGRVEKYTERAGFDSIEKIARLVSLALKTDNADKVKVFLEQFSGRTNLATRLNEIFEYRKIEQTDVCPECHSDNLKHQTGCKQCLDCGWEKCGL